MPTGNRVSLISRWSGYWFMSDKEGSWNIFSHRKWVERKNDSLNRQLLTTRKDLTDLIDLTNIHTPICKWLNLCLVFHWSIILPFTDTQEQLNSILSAILGKGKGKGVNVFIDISSFVRAINCYKDKRMCDSDIKLQVL